MAGDVSLGNGSLHLQYVLESAVQLLDTDEQWANVFPDSPLVSLVLPDFQFHGISAIKITKFIVNYIKWKVNFSLPFPVENEAQTEFGVTTGPHPLVNENCHVFAGDSENCLCKDVCTDEHVSPESRVNFVLGRVRRKRKLLVEHLQKSNA